MTEITSTKILTKGFIFLNKIDSTNEHLKVLCEKKQMEEWTIVCSFNQTSGRGYAGNKWQSEAGKNICLSILLKPSFLKPDNSFALNKIVSLAVAETLEHFANEDFKVKWPNDIYFKNKKVAGILIENQIRSDAIKQAIVGIGINVNQTDFKNLPNAVSLKSIAGIDFELFQIIEQLITSLDKIYKSLKEDAASKIDAAYLNKLFGNDIWMNFKNSKGNIFKGKIVGIDKIGKLKILSEQSKILSFGFKEVEFMHNISD